MKTESCASDMFYPATISGCFHTWLDVGQNKRSQSNPGAEPQDFITAHIDQIGIFAAELPALAFPYRHMEGREECSPCF